MNTFFRGEGASGPSPDPSSLGTCEIEVQQLCVLRYKKEMAVSESSKRSKEQSLQKRRAHQMEEKTLQDKDVIR